MNPPYHSNQNLLLPQELNKNNFDLLRFLFASCVIYSHCFVLLYLKMEDVETLRLLTHNQVDFGGIAVSFFFVISGFLIVRSYVFSTSLRAYLTKRVLRIVPGFAVAFLVSVFIIGALGTASSAHPLGDWSTYLSRMRINRIAWQFFTLETPRGARTFATNPLPNMVNESLWTIQYEFLCYLLVPLVGLAGFVKRRGFVLACFLVAYVLFVLKQTKLVYMYAYDNEWNLFLPYPSELPRFFAYFFSGALFYLYRDRIVRSRAITALCVAALVFTAWWGWGLHLVLPLAGTYLLFYVAYHPRIRFHHFAIKGDYSYGLYLYGWPVQQLVLYFFAKHLNAQGLFIISFPVVLAAAYFSWHVVEKRFLNKKGHLKSGMVLKGAGTASLVTANKAYHTLKEAIAFAGKRR